MDVLEQHLTAIEVYEKPEITDLGTLEQLTAACGPNGGGDSTSFLLSFTDSHGHFCNSN